MKTIQVVTRVLVSWLSAEEQARMAADTVTWLCAGLPPAERQAEIQRLAPGLAERVRQGQFGLGLVAYYHLLRLPPLRWCHQWILPVESRAGELSIESMGMTGHLQQY
ncbi:MAG TPA: hypothetical protein VLY63_20375 [Anaerolineae bacterium]|nr:hypothetical protein [Anaerolineae bacterium]